jgi:uncharacterized protein (TIGR02246 family)
MRAVSCLTFLLLCGCTIKVELVRFGAGAEEVAAAVAASWREHIAAAQRKDLPGVAAIYADDAVYAVAGQAELRGKAAIEAMEARGLQASDVGAVEHETLALRVDGVVAYELGTIAGDVTPRGAAARHVVFHFLAAWQRGPDGTWRIAHLVGHAEEPAEQ